MSLIEVKGLCKSFGNLEVLKDVSFTVDEGEVVVIIGGSGCGKSVTLRSIELLEKPDKGQISLTAERLPPRVRTLTLSAVRWVWCIRASICSLT